MQRSLHYAFFIAFCCFTYSAQGQAQPSGQIEEQIGNLSPDERYKLLNMIQENLLDQSDDALKNMLKNLGPEKQKEIKEYILLIKNADYQPASQVDFDTDTVDFGLQPIGRILRDTVHFKVVGQQPYIIKNSVSSCPQLSTELPEYPFMTDQIGDFILKLDTRKLTPGPVRLAISVRGNNYPNRRKIFYVKADLYDGRDLKIARP